ncbi:MAG: hypothetical protein GC181_15670 [Bacteroidetes bacterium]|nr:hypothetical protein [Bacteroidota bacterium]
MNAGIIFIILLSTGIVLFILSVVYRRRKKLRTGLIVGGILIGVIPMLVYFSLQLMSFIRERNFVGTYIVESEDVGKVEIRLFENNTFEMTAAECSVGFVQGEWKWKWIGTDGCLNFISTSQRMGDADIHESEILKFRHVPVCLKLSGDLHFKRTTRETGKPREEFSY